MPIFRLGYCDLMMVSGKAETGEGRVGGTSLILNVGSRCKVNGQIHAPAALSPGKYDIPIEYDAGLAV